jgi:hypothetical protein
MKFWRSLLLALVGALALFAGCTKSAPPVQMTKPATPAQIIFLRHAEKLSDAPELSERGWARAKALATLFTHDPRVLEHGPAAAIYVMKLVKIGDSVRTTQTMEATAGALKIKLERRHSRDEIDELVHSVLKSKVGNGKTIIICWEHKLIPDMLKALGWTSGPKKWDDDVYDRLWVLDFAEGKPTRFRDLPQKLLPGDSEK